MFDRFVRLAQARSALQRGDHEGCLRVLADPSLRPHRRIDSLRAEALDGFEERIRARLIAGDLAGARAGLEQMQRLGAGTARVQAVSEALEAVDREAGSLDERLSVQGNGVRDALDRGALSEAREAWKRADELRAADSDPRRERLVARWGEEIEQRALQAKTALESARGALRRGEAAEACEEFVRARSLDVEAAQASGLAAKIARDLGRSLAGESVAEGGSMILRRAVERLPDLAEEPEFRRAFERAQDRVRVRLSRLVETGDIEAAVKLAETEGDIADVVESLREGLHSERVGHDQVAAARWAELAEVLGSKRLRKRAKQCEERIDADRERSERIRGFLAAGNVDEAQERVNAWLSERPEHEVARSLRAEVEVSQRAWTEQLRRIEELRDQGQVATALGQLQTIQVPDSRRGVLDGLREELDRRRSHVSVRRDELLRELHGRTSGSAEGVQALIDEVLELQSLQCDDPGLERLHRALVSEHAGLEALDSLRDQIRAGRVDGVRATADAQIERRGDLLDPDRLRAREVEIVELATTQAGRRLDTARPVEALSWLEAVEPLGHSESADVLRRRAKQAIESASRLARSGLSALRKNKVDRARDLLAEARLLAVDDPEVRRLERALDGGLDRLDVLERAEQGIARKDFSAAAAALRDIGPTPAGLRTQVFDLKRDLAKAQGLGDAFVLRVDDAGEFLVARGESISIGNLREGLADLPMLARLKGLHARLRRSMSFHGGQVDRIEAEAGTLLDRQGRSCERIDLDGPTRFRLGDAVEFRYQRPSDRSLSAILSLHGGFRVGGCERMVWMKDRGRDGRVLLGPARDSHVQISRATGEVELYAERDGRIYISVDGEGEIDGKPFAGRHPVVPGAVIRAVGLEFVVVPWARN